MRLARTSARTRSLRASRGFSLLDLLVSIAVMGVLMGILLPALSHATEATRRVVCRSNVRQMGLCVAMFAEDNNGATPPSVYTETVERGAFQPQAMMELRVADSGTTWDGLGWLFANDYIRTPEIFYCPSHRGEHPFSTYEPIWHAPDVAIVGNYHLRALFGDDVYLANLDPSTALVADGMRTVEDYNHKVGSNVLRADISVGWFPDTQGLMTEILPMSAASPNADESVVEAWWLMERGTLDGFPGLPWSEGDNGGLDDNSGFSID